MQHAWLISTLSLKSRAAAGRIRVPWIVIPCTAHARRRPTCTHSAAW